MSDIVGPEGSVERPYRETPPERLVEVHWSGTLAVHFFAGAGPAVPDPDPPSLRRR